MTDSQTPTYRSHTTPPGDSIELRQPEDEDGVFEVRMPIATTGEVRNDGDDPLTRDELDGMARQINDGGLGVFLDHGGSSLGGPQRYSAVGKIGEWTDATLDGERDDGTDALMATARLMDPESLPNGVKELRAAVGAIQEQVKRGFSVASSIGWREDDSYPGGNDLMEASIVGIGADPRTTSQATDDAGLVARAAVDAGTDPDALLETVRAAVADESDTEEAQEMTDDDTGDEAGTTDEEQTAPDEGDEETERAEAPEWASDIRDLLESIHEAVREDDMDDDEDDEDEQEMDDDEEEDEDEDEEDMEQSADSDDTDERIAELEEELEKVRNGELDVETPDDDTEPSAEQEADDVSSDTTDDWRKHAHN